MQHELTQLQPPLTGCSLEPALLSTVGFHVLRKHRSLGRRTVFHPKAISVTYYVRTVASAPTTEKSNMAQQSHQQVSVECSAKNITTFAGAAHLTVGGKE